MSAEARYFRVGLFVLAGVATIGACAVMLGGQQLFRQPVLFETYFDESVQGLSVGSPVALRGVKIGSVSEIGLVSQYYELPEEDLLTKGQWVLVRMQVTREGQQGARPAREDEARLQQFIARGLRLRVSPSGITGTALIQADYLNPETHPALEISWQPQHAYVPSAQSTFRALSSAVDRIMERVEKVPVEKLLVDLDEFVLKLGRAVDQTNLAELSARATALVEELRATNFRAQRALGSEGVVGDADSAFQQLHRTLEQAQAAIAQLHRLVDGASFDVQATLENLRVSTENLRQLTDTAREYPSVLLLGEPPARRALPAP
jgi:phospholipid/cholesterol/gamma-HCH transport system substrate-binding protein/paraquat-inducible protein B